MLRILLYSGIRERATWENNVITYHHGLYMTIAERVRAYSSASADTSVLALFYLRSPMIRFREALEGMLLAVRGQCKVSTLDAAQGLEANHVILVFTPRVDDTLEGIQRDPGRFYQGATCWGC